MSHQLCLFHVTQRLTDLAKKTIRDLRKQLPKRTKTKGSYATQADVAATLELLKAGTSIRQISKKLGVSRYSIKAWIKRPQLAAERHDIDVNAPHLATCLEENTCRTTKRQRNDQTDIPDGWSSWDQVDCVATALKKLAFQISSRKLVTTASSFELYKACLTSPIGSDVSAIREFIDEWYDLFTDTAAAPEKWLALKQKHLVESCKRFKPFQKQMNEGMYKKLSASFKDVAFEKTSNGTERFARKVKRIQKSRYRLRTEKSLLDFILLERLLHGCSLKHEEMDQPSPFKARLC